MRGRGPIPPTTPPPRETNSGPAVIRRSAGELLSRLECEIAEADKAGRTELPEAGAACQNPHMNSRASELALVERIRRLIPAPRGRQLVMGIGDDCAIVRAPGLREDWLLSTDMLIEGVHFARETHSAADAGHKALARGLSDIAAMGASPRFCLVSLVLPEWAGPRWVDGFYRGLARLAKETGAVVVGGDLARADRLFCDIVVIGAAPPGASMRRDRARTGDAVYVSGMLGGSALGLDTRRGTAWLRHRRPQPRLELGRYLRARLGVKAAMDLSDGLSLDLHRLTRESRVAAVIDRPLPVFPGASLDQALHGGEDYELLFTAPPRLKMPAFWRGVPLTRIGSVTSGPPGAVEFFGEPLAAAGYDHFRPLTARQGAGRHRSETSIMPGDIHSSMSSGGQPPNS